MKKKKIYIYIYIYSSGKKREEIEHNIQAMALLGILLQIKMHSPILKNKHTHTSTIQIKIPRYSTGDQLKSRLKWILLYYTI